MALAVFPLSVIYIPVVKRVAPLVLLPRPPLPLVHGPVLEGAPPVPLPLPAVELPFVDVARGILVPAIPVHLVVDKVPSPATSLVC